MRGVAADVGSLPGACERKRRYRTKKQAKAAIRVMEQKPGMARLNAYRCRWCGAWHIGNPPPAWLKAAYRHELEGAPPER